jgi:hypothetical protein
MDDAAVPLMQMLALCQRPSLPTPQAMQQLASCASGLRTTEGQKQPMARSTTEGTMVSAGATLIDAERMLSQKMWVPSVASNTVNALHIP